MTDNGTLPITEIGSAEELDQRLRTLGQEPIRALAIRDSGLTALPDALRQLTHLEYLNLSGNRLAALPAWLGELTGLKRLHLDGNRLAALSDVLANVTQLEELHLENNGLTT